MDEDDMLRLNSRLLASGMKPWLDDARSRQLGVRMAPTCSLLAIVAQDWAKQRSLNPEKFFPHPSTHPFV
ncbi:hypothetical protein NEUTE2DRAFT_60619 [Neurospora tetrasperma FGSC 2509]|nr:hypothetical protein NEUTE2DRAFT_60619 [Neurospora tetrasperma FGSC 2509]